MKPIRFGIVGVGGFGHHRRECLRKAGVFELVGGVDVRAEAFVAAEKEEGRPVPRFSSVEALAADPSVEAVFVATPARLHVEQAMIAARAGKAIFVEKPLGHDLAACRELVRYCEEKGVPHGHGFGARFSPIWQEVRRLLEMGLLGRIVSVSAATMHTGGLIFSSDNWRFCAGKNPGGPLFQCGIHKVDILRFLFGEGRWVAGFVQRTITASPTDDAYVLLGQFGKIPCTFHSHYVASYRHAMEIYGTKGDLFISEFPDKLEHKATDPAGGVEPIRDLTPAIPASEAELESLCDFAAAIRERRQPKMSGLEGLKSLELVFQAVQVSTEIA